MPIDALKTSTSISSPFIVAGAPFTITTTVSNGHEEKVEIMSYRYLIPYQVQWIADVDYAKAYDEFRSRYPLMRALSTTPWKKAAVAPGTTLTVTGDLNATPPKPLQTILSGESQSYSFKALVPTWLFVTGNEVRFDGFIAYRYKNEDHTSPFHVSFPLRPPLKSNILGAILGGLLGTMARFLKDFDTTATVSVGAFATASALSVILGVILVVFSSRKADVQPILTIEDVWGGMLAGFLVGYLGHTFFSKVVNLGS